jgi:hypothetical protein
MTLPRRHFPACPRPPTLVHNPPYVPHFDPVAETRWTDSFSDPLHSIFNDHLHRMEFLYEMLITNPLVLPTQIARVLEVEAPYEVAVGVIEAGSESLIIGAA